MQFLSLTLPTSAENVALDEALLDEAEEGPAEGGEVLRVWEARQPAVVIGRSSRVHEEVNVPACRERGIPILRRPSGGAAVVAGPGCLMYAVVLSYALRPKLRLLDQAHQFVLQHLTAALQSQIDDVRQAGISDVAWGDKKISGNSVRCKRTHFLYHGTLLYNFPLELIQTCLQTAPRQPEYRRQRDHSSFVTNAPVNAAMLVDSLRRQWDARSVLSEWPRRRVQSLVDERYGREEWTMRR